MAPKSKAGNKSSATPIAAATPQPPPPSDPVVDILASQPVVDKPSFTIAKSKSQRLAYPVPDHISPETINNTESLLRFLILGLISAAAIGSRLFAVIRFESVIHEL